MVYCVQYCTVYMWYASLEYNEYVRVVYILYGTVPLYCLLVTPTILMTSLALPVNHEWHEWAESSRCGVHVCIYSTSSTNDDEQQPAQTAGSMCEHAPS
jgi:hypothetical protein